MAKLESLKENKFERIREIKQILFRYKKLFFAIGKLWFLFSRNNELILENTELKDNDELKLLSVISGC